MENSKQGYIPITCLTQRTITTEKERIKKVSILGGFLLFVVELDPFELAGFRITLSNFPRLNF